MSKKISLPNVTLIVATTINVDQAQIAEGEFLNNVFKLP